MTQTKTPRTPCLKVSKTELFGSALLAFAAILCTIYFWYDSYSNLRKTALDIGNSIEAPLNLEDLRALSGSPADTVKPEYKRLKRKLTEIAESNPSTKFAYFFIHRNDKLYFLVDSEPENSADYSPPGQEYFEATEIDKSIFKTKRRVITPPTKDRWGEWVSNLTPIIDTDGRVIAGFGLDFDALIWKKEAIRDISILYIFILTSFFLLVIVTRFVLINRKLEMEINRGKNLEKILIKNEIRLTNLLQNLPGMVYQCIADSPWTTVYAGGACLQITGYPPESFLNKKEISFTDLILPEYRKMVSEKWSNAITKKLSIDLQYKIKDRFGAEKWIWERAFPIFDPNHHIIYLEGYIEDVTQQVEAAQELKNAKQKAEESDRLKSAFLANLSHEIRTPVNGILGFTEILTEENISDEERTEYLRIIGESANRLVTLIKDLVDISLIETGQIRISNSNIQVSNLMDELFRFFKHDAEKKHLTLINHGCRVQDAVLYSDEARLYQIMGNLIRNAIKFTAEGIISFGVEVSESHFHFYVSDSGKGIPESFRAKIFDPFRQGDEELTRSYEGMGLGLAISKSLIALLGGEIKYASTDGRGSTFSLVIPHLDEPVFQISANDELSLSNSR